MAKKGHDTSSQTWQRLTIFDAPKCGMPQLKAKLIILRLFIPSSYGQIFQWTVSRIDSIPRFLTSHPGFKFGCLKNKICYLIGGSEAEISDLDVVVTVDEDVGRLQVP